MMRLLRIVLSLYAGMISVFVLLFFLGDAGMGKYSDLNRYKQALEENILELKTINVSLNQEFKSLGTDPEKIKLLARELGYFAAEDRVIRVEGFSTRRSFYKVGKIIFPYRESRFHLPRILGIIITVLFYILYSFIGRATRHDNKPRSA